ncbi:hypothetical protein Hanom_Chr13g01233891 [Helianthus anomalus]
MKLLPNGYPLHSKISWTTRPSMLLISISFEGHHWWSHREPEQRDGPMAM